MSYNKEIEKRYKQQQRMKNKFDAAARKKVYGGGSPMKRKGYKHGGMEGCQPTYSEDMPKAKAN